MHRVIFVAALCVLAPGCPEPPSPFDTPRPDAPVLDAGADAFIRMLDVPRPDVTPDCTARLDCNDDPADGCEVDPQANDAHCGGCGLPCALGDECDDGACGPTSASTGEDGAFHPTSDTVLMPGIYQFDTITIPAGVRVTTTGSGVLDLRSAGNVVIEGTIDVSGGDGVAGRSLANAATMFLEAPAGGNTGRSGDGGRAEAWAILPGPRPTLGIHGSSGAGGLGVSAQSLSLDSTSHALVPAGSFGGGRGSLGFPSPAPGGGFAGGCALGGRAPRESALIDCVPPFAREDPTAPPGDAGGAGPNTGEGGGPGTIGPLAWADPEVRSTFRPGSGGGGGAGGRSPTRVATGGGGGGGGGALRIRSETSIRVAGSGALLAAGGAGGAGGTCAEGGGGGSGGVIYLMAPSISTDPMTRMSVAGGAPGAVTTDACTTPAPVGGGRGGTGRLRIATDDCSGMLGTSEPAIPSGCPATTRLDQPHLPFISGFDLPRSCREILELDASATDGNYTIGPAPGLRSVDVYCDMAHGGMTLIMATGGVGPGDLSSSHVVHEGAGGYLPLQHVVALARISREVHIRTAGMFDTRSMTSVPDAAPIMSLRDGHTTCFDTDITSASSNVTPYWAGPMANAATLWHMDGEADYPNIYWAENNAGGTHVAHEWSRWTFDAADEPIEVYLR